MVAFSIVLADQSLICKSCLDVLPECVLDGGVVEADRQILRVEDGSSFRQVDVKGVLTDLDHGGGVVDQDGDVVEDGEGLGVVQKFLQLLLVDVNLGDVDTLERLLDGV